MAAQAVDISKHRASAEGVGCNQKAVKYLGQDFETLKQQCLNSGVLFKDPEFPACPSALGYKDLGLHSPKTQGIIWKRPTELCSSPQFIIGGATCTDICQGGLGDCWLLAAIASLTLNEELLYRVVPKDQNFQKDYAGIFHFQFWQYGEWVEVVIDDRLPTKNGQLLFLHSEEGNEFWSALLEKAYAKLNGSYEALAGGSTVEGFEDFTGGISEFYDLKKPPSCLYQIIRKALRAGSLLGCSIDVSSAAEVEAITSQKLVKSHAYSVTGVQEVDFRGRPEKLIRLRNPWGEVEWSGAWSDDAPEWNDIDPRQKEELDKKAEDGEFWMSFSDFLKQFSRLEICNLSPDSLSSEEVHKWNLLLFNGRWTRGSSAGGCQNYPATYWTNPQFKIHLDEVDEDQEEGDGEPCCTVLLGLMQKNHRRQKRIGQGMLSIGYAVYQPHPSKMDQEDGQFKSLLEKLAEKDSEISANELKKVLNGAFSKRTDIKFDGFNINTCREMISLLDSHGTGTLGPVEFKMLWLKIQKYLEIYQEMDHNHMDTIDAHDMRTALKKAGFILNNQVQQTIAVRYACSKLGIDFDSFVACMIRLETLFKLFRLLDKNQDGIIQLSLAEVNGLRFDELLVEVAVLRVGLTQGFGRRRHSLRPCLLLFSPSLHFPEHLSSSSIHSLVIHIFLASHCALGSWPVPAEQHPPVSCFS
ncbi:calpain-8 isoform X1 [Nycticebus coucang]|uniref:calpain-8 isoform X1 n=1 Tax=Nycticebus coucang TaxID=9470 RepID=UPI00234C2568|nr:calpain-8 isoform X1 [Nycticebus coucang]